MSFRTFDFYAFPDLDAIVEVKFNYLKDTDISEGTARQIETFATGKFLMLLTTILFEKEADAVYFKLRNER